MKEESNSTKASEGESINDEVLFMMRISKGQIEEAKKIEEDLRKQLKDKEFVCETLENEVVSLRKLEKSSQQFSNENTFQKGTMTLDGLLSSQKQSLDKSGVGYDESQCSKSSEGEQHKPNAGFIPKNRNGNFNKFSNTRQAHMIRYNNAYFHGYCFSCNYFGHKAINCRIFLRRTFSFVNQNPFAPLRNHNYVCYKCNYLGHSAKFCDNILTSSSKKMDVKGKAKESVKFWRKKEMPSSERSLVVQTVFLAKNEKDISYVDSGCFRHMTGGKDKFQSLRKMNGGKSNLEVTLQQELQVLVLLS